MDSDGGNLKASLDLSDPKLQEAEAGVEVGKV